MPGVTVAKNEGYKTIISIRGIGNETNQNAIAAPSVAYHMDGIFIASPFSLQTDFIDVQRIEVQEVLKEHYLGKTLQVAQ